MIAPHAVQASVNGQAITRPGEVLSVATLRQRACSELLRQAAQDLGLLGIEEHAPDDGVHSRDASDAIEKLLELELKVPEPDDDACRRHHAVHQAAYRRGERVQLRHILLAVTPGTDLVALRALAEQTLLEVRCDESGEIFSQRASEISNCPSGARGGALDWLGSTDMAPEFAREVLGRREIGVLPRLVLSRFGLHIVEVLAREGGEDLAYEEVREPVLLALRQHSWATALRQYLSVLAGRARLDGVSLDGSDTPLVQ